MSIYHWPSEAERKAQVNLAKVVKALRMRDIRDECSPSKIAFELVTVAGVFQITPGYIIKRNGGATCFSAWCGLGAMPPHEELVASAALLLYRDPSIFDRWAQQDGPHV